MTSVKEKSKIITEMLEEMKQVPNFKHLFIKKAFTSKTKEVREKMGSSGGFMPYPTPIEYEVESTRIFEGKSIIQNVDLENTKIKDDCLYIYDNRGFQEVIGVEIMTGFYYLNDEMLHEFKKIK